MDPKTAKPSASRPALWFGLLGAAVAWTMHLISAYATAEFGCVGGWGASRYANVSVVAWLEIGLTAVNALIAAVATLIAWRSHQHLLSISTKEDEVLNAERNLAWAGILTSGLFTFIIVFESIPILYYLRAC